MGRFFFWIAFVLLAYPASTSAQSKSPFAWETGLDFVYDDNILRYSDHDILNPKLADLLYEPYILVQYKRSFQTYPTTLFSDLTADFYQDNRYKNYQSLRFGLKQALPGHSSILMSGTLMPEFHVSETRSLRYTSLYLEGRRTMTPRLELRAALRLGKRNYDLDRYDTDFWEPLLQVSYKFRNIKIGGGYSYERGDATGDQEFDPSYKEQAVHAFMTLTPARMSRVTLKYGYSSRDFTTSKSTDVFRRGRSDIYNSYTLRYSHDLARRVEGRIGVEHTGRDVSGILPQYERLLDYSENSYLMGISTYW
jgi:hypothetical protein